MRGKEIALALSLGLGMGIGAAPVRADVNVNLDVDSLDWSRPTEGWDSLQVSDVELDARRGGLRVRGLEIDLGLRLHEHLNGILQYRLDLRKLDGSKPLRTESRYTPQPTPPPSTDLPGLPAAPDLTPPVESAAVPPVDTMPALPAAAATSSSPALPPKTGIGLVLTNTMDDVQIQRDIDVDIAVRNFRQVFGGLNDRGLRQIGKSFLRRLHMR